jgi:hypothetical protein
MFSANENLMLRQHKRRVVNHIESTIPEHALDMGTSVMVMQTTCKTPGCVPLETSVIVVFPRDKTQYIDGVPESCGGTFKTKILMPLSEVTLDDVLDALPPGFKGGRKTWESTCLHLRDFTLGRIGGTVGIGSTDIEIGDRKMLAEYLIACLGDYVNNGCVAPGLGLPFPEQVSVSSTNVSDDNNATLSTESVESVGKTKSSNIETIDNSISSSKDNDIDKSEKDEQVEENNNNSIKQDRKVLPSQTSHTKNQTETATTTPAVTPAATVSTKNLNQNKTETAMDWRRRQNMSQSLQLPSSNTMIQKLAQKEFTCMRDPSCPCCDSDSVFDINNGLMSL